MRFRAGLIISAFITLFLAGCLGEEPVNQEDNDVQLMTYRPINDGGILDVVPPSIPPRDTSPVCRVLDVADPFRVHDLYGSIEWESTSNRTETLRLTLKTGAAGAEMWVEGSSPLTLTASEFTVSMGDKFGVVISLVGEEVLDPLLDPQEVNFRQGFVAQLEPERPDTNLGLWSSECPQ